MFGIELDLFHFDKNLDYEIFTALHNDQIKKMDWNKKWQTDYPKTERAKQEVETLKKPEVKDALKEVFTEESLVMSRLGEAF